MRSSISAATRATLTVLPRQIEAGNPDMRVWSGQQHVTGYIEAKEPGTTNLDDVEVSEQSKPYQGAFARSVVSSIIPTTIGILPPVVQAHRHW